MPLRSPGDPLRSCSRTGHRSFRRTLCIRSEEHTSEIFQSQVSLSEEKSLNAEDIRQLKKIPFVMVASRQKLRQVADEILRKAGIRPDICCTTKSMETAKRLAAGGMGATFLPKSYMTLYSGTEGLSCYPLDKELGASWKLVAAYPADEKLSRASREFLRTLKECLE